MDRKRFFDSVRNAPFAGSLTQSQVEGMTFLLDAMQAEAWPVEWAAYGLATAYHEVAGTMQPIREVGGDRYFRRMYDITGERPHVARELGNIHPGDGVRFHGRGYVQLTGRRNYQRAMDTTGVDLITRPDLAMEPAMAARIMVEGMEDGWFTGKANRHYLNQTPPDYRNARRIINGTDRADLIAGYARAFERALRSAGYAPGVKNAAPPVTPRPAAPISHAPEPAPVIPPPPDTPKPAPAGEPRKGFWARFWEALTRRVKG